MLRFLDPFQPHLEVYEIFIWQVVFLFKKGPVISNTEYLDIKLLKPIQYSQKSDGSIEEKAIRQLSHVSERQMNLTR